MEDDEQEQRRRKVEAGRAKVNGSADSSRCPGVDSLRAGSSARHHPLPGADEVGRRPPSLHSRFFRRLGWEPPPGRRHLESAALCLNPPLPRSPPISGGGRVAFRWEAGRGARRG